MRAKKAELAAATADSPQPASLCNPAEEPAMPSASMRKIGDSVPSVQPRVDYLPTGYAIGDSAVVAALFSPLTCSLCSSKLSLRANPNCRGFAHYLTVVCSGCGNIEASSMTSKLLTGGNSMRSIVK
ncbi:hypothetical protein PoB_004096500 [Plakobranchus ocellatus]|uniref:Uncharacterized protein n=1 Tax=Plakobranchus ocellatus TaxID=259542 RepID=A0AAV4B5Y7_9GAST|nr:hypothetical protein PoB_004096500 [Plakobranchus ocellatus]